MNRRRWFPMVLCVVSLAACFHQVVTTGRTAASTPVVIDKQWVTTWLWGLVAADEIDVRKECPAGVAVVTTEMSFMNGLATAITLGIWAPQHVTVTCAGGMASLPSKATELRIASDATAAQSAAVLDRAIEIASESGAPVVLRY
jgi:hypothetical protein